MDESNDGRNPRPPQIADVVKLCKSLNEQGVLYVVIGGFAVILHGALRNTKDVDLLVVPSVENAQKLKKAMSVLEDNAVSEIEDEDIARHQVVRVADEFVVDLMANACGIDYEQIKNGIEWVEIDGVRIPIASKEWLIRTKDTIRLSDKVDIGFLLREIDGEKKAAEKNPGKK